jgi:HAD superfamily hydrolase (TIGR01490 family)
MEETSNRTIAVFDFDGTLTKTDTLLLFIRYSCGTIRFILGMTLFSPLIILMMLRLYPNWKCKEKVFSHFFKGMPYEKFKRLGEDFGNQFRNVIIRPSMKERLLWHLEQGHKVYVISASIEEWVKPFFRTLGDVTVLATKVRPDLSGFISKNCYGQEKVNRLLEMEPERNTYTLYTYGDSRGDKEMLAFADFPTLIR